MNIFKKNLLVLFILLRNFTVIATPADVIPYFLPEDCALFDSVLDTYFNDIAHREVYLASYWLTDQKTIDKLIELKKRGVDVNVIFDITTNNFDELFRVLFSNQILPIFSPFGDESRMHNKFIIIDDEDVLTGSANFTRQALGICGNRNFENIVRIKSREIVTKYKRAFYNIKDTIFEKYLEDIACQNEENWHKFYQHLLPVLFEIEPQFRGKVITYLKTRDKIQIDRLIKLIPKAACLSKESSGFAAGGSFFGALGGSSLSTRLPSSHLVISMSPKQRSIVLDAGYDPDKISSRAELSQIITDFFKSKQLRKKDMLEVESSESLSEESSEESSEDSSDDSSDDSLEDSSEGSSEGSSEESVNPVSQKQRAILIAAGYDPDEFSSYDEAYKFIGNLGRTTKKRDR